MKFDKGILSINLRCPRFLTGIFDRWFPNLLGRAAIHGKASSSRSWLKGIVEVQAIAVRDDPDDR